LVLFDFNNTDAQPQLHAHIQTDHNTGWQTKDTRLVVMSDNDDTDVVGSGELISNGDFSGGTTNWTTNGTSIITDQGGYIRVDRNSGSAANQCYQDITTVVGETYMIRAKVLATNNQYASIYHPGGETKSTTPATADILTGSFVATGTTSRIELAATGGSSITADFDDVSCMLAVDDRSAKFQSIPVYGTIPKQVCDTGTDLVSYGPFSTSNYMEAPYNDELNFGTGDFHFSGWFNMTSTTSQGLISRVADGLGGTQAGFAMNTASSGVLGWAMYTTGLHSSGRTNCGFGFTPKTNVWNHVVAMRKSGVMYLYLNGQLDTNIVPANTDDITDTTNSPPLTIGLLANAGSPANATKLALWRISPTAPTEEQILKMFNDEKLMFEINAKATLYWDTTSTNRQRISGLAYDPITKRIHAGTSSGRSEFQGLIRVNNSTDAVGTNITSVDGLVAEG
jgi:hypothetical protein